MKKFGKKPEVPQTEDTGSKQAIIVFSSTLWFLAPPSWPLLLMYKYPSLHLLPFPCCCGGSSSIQGGFSSRMQWYWNRLPFSGDYPSHWWKGEGLFLSHQCALKDVGRGLPALSNKPDWGPFFRKKVLIPPNKPRIAMSITQIIRN